MRFSGDSRVSPVLESSCITHTLRFSVRGFLALTKKSLFFEASLILSNLQIQFSVQFKIIDMDLQLNIQSDVTRALQEDIGSGDISALLIDESARLDMNLLVREDAVLCGCAWFDEVFRQCDASIIVEWSARDGDRVKADTVLCTVSGPARAVLSAERCALNFLQTLSGNYNAPIR